MDEDIIPTHDQIRQILHDQTKNPDHHPLMKQIDQWENVSIEKIHSAADDARQQLMKSINNHMSQMKEQIERLTQQLKKLAMMIIFSKQIWRNGWESSIP